LISTSYHTFFSSNGLDSGLFVSPGKFSPEEIARFNNYWISWIIWCSRAL